MERAFDTSDGSDMVPSTVINVLEFVIDETRYAIVIERVVEIIPRVRIAPLPSVPRAVMGVINYRGDVAIAIDMRTLLGRPARAPSLSDPFVLARGRRRLFALIVDRVTGIADVEKASVQTLDNSPRHIAGVVPLAHELLLVEDLDAALTEAEEAQVDASLAEVADS